MNTTSSSSPISIRLVGERIERALDRHHGIAGFDQATYSLSHVLCIGAGGLISNIAPTLCRKGIGALTILDDDTVEVSNLNRQRFYRKDVGENKAVALVKNLQPECTFSTVLTGHGLRLEEAIEEDFSLDCNVAFCGVDNNPTRMLAGIYFRNLGIPVIFSAVSNGGDFGYVFVQQPSHACVGCLFPDLFDDHRYPCPGTPAIADVLQALGGLSTYALDSLVTNRPRLWNYRTLRLATGTWDASCEIQQRPHCPLCSRSAGANV